MRKRGICFSPSSAASTVSGQRKVRYSGCLASCSTSVSSPLGRPCGCRGWACHVVSPSSFISVFSLARWRSSVSQSLPCPGVLSRQRGGVAGQARRLGVGLLGRVDVLGAVAEPLVRHAARQSRRIGEAPLSELRLGQPGGEDAVQDRLGQVRLLDADGLVVGLVVQPAGGVVVARRSCRRRCCTACSGSGRSR